MPITESDIKLLQSARMTDTSDGGGRMTGNVVQSGVDNNIFDDVSNLDRVYGNVSMRKVFPAVLTNTTDKYLGARVIIDEPPEDTNIDGTLFSASSLFDIRDAAKARLEAYLAPGAPYQGLLYGPHIAGMMTVLLFQQEDRELPAIGDTLLLRQMVGSVLREQYVRLTSVSGEIATFTDSNGNFTRRVVTCTIGDALRYDFTGLEARRVDSDIDFTLFARVYTTLVANAAQYYGIKPLQTAASVGAFNIKATSAFSSLVPSAQLETALLDVSASGFSAAYPPTGTTVTFNTSNPWQVTMPLSIGSSVAAGSLSASIGGVGTVTDNGVGALLLGGVEIGSIDYANGIMVLADATYNNGGNNTITYEIAAPTILALQSDYTEVTIAGRSLTQVKTLFGDIEPKTLNVSYMANGKWYVLRDKGDGVIRGDVDGIGAGQVNYSTKSVSVTLGALPDVGSHIIYQWGLKEAIISNVGLPQGTDTPAMMFETSITATDSTENVTVTWNDGGPQSFGWSRTGGHTGSGGTFKPYGSKAAIVFDYLPPKGTNVTVVGQVRTPVDANYVATDKTSFTLPTPPLPRSLNFTINIQQVFSIGDGMYNGYSCVLQIATYHGDATFSNSNKTVTILRSIPVRDDGYGNIQFDSSAAFSGDVYCKNLTTFGTVDYTTGLVSLTGAILHGPTWEGPSIWGWSVATGTGAMATTWQGWQGATRTATTNVPAQAGTVYYRTGTLTPVNITEPVNKLVLPISTPPSGYEMSQVSFKLGTKPYRRSTSNPADLVTNFNSVTGGGTVVGTVATGNVTLTEWVAGVASAVGDFAAGATRVTEAANASFTADRIVFRAPTAPLRPGSFTVSGRMGNYRGSGNTPFTVTADENGIINAPNLFGYVDFNTGICVLYGQAFGGSPEEIAELEQLPDLNVPAWLTARNPGWSSYNPGMIVTSSVTYNAVAYSYLPLDATVLGLDPVRLPSDGRVPIYKAGRVVVVHNTQKLAPQTVANSQTVNCGRTLLARIRVFGNDGLEITSGFTKNLDAGTITFTNVAGYSQPVTIEHRIEDEALCTDAQITGDLRLSRPLTHAYPANTSYVSSAYIAGTLQAAAQDSFAQETWTNVWSNERIGNTLLAQYDDTTYPLVVTNAGAITERWAIIFTSNTTFNLVGEEVGQIITGDTATPLAPVNPATGVPYFTLQPSGWGSGWVAGNVLRFNTSGANFPLWIARTVRQSPSAPPGTDQMTISIRGDIDQ